MGLITEVFCLVTPRWDEECDVRVDCRKNGLYRMVFEFDSGEKAIHWDNDPWTLIRELQKEFDKTFTWKEPIKFNMKVEV